MVVLLRRNARIRSLHEVRGISARTREETRGGVEQEGGEGFVVERRRAEAGGGGREDGSRVSLTDLHKGTHNCAAAIRESGAGISPSPARPLPLFRSPLVVHPVVVHPQSPPPPRREGDGESPGTQSVRCYHFSTRVGGRCRWFLA